MNFQVLKGTIKPISTKQLILHRNNSCMNYSAEMTWLTLESSLKIKMYLSTHSTNLKRSSSLKVWPTGLFQSTNQLKLSSVITTSWNMTGLEFKFILLGQKITIRHYPLHCKWSQGSVMAELKCFQYTLQFVTNPENATWSLPLWEISYKEFNSLRFNFH